MSTTHEMEMLEIPYYQLGIANSWRCLPVATD